jgi:hypothetical protein
VLAGRSSGALDPVASAPWNGLETRIPVASSGPYFAVQARDGSGAVIAETSVIRRSR